MIRIYFSDGTHEERLDTCLCAITEEAPSWTPDTVTGVDRLSAEILSVPRDPGMWVVTERGPLRLGGDASGARTLPLRGWRGSSWPWVWRITGGQGEREPLTGAWASCRVETADEQIGRLTQQRDAARRLAALCLRALTGPELAEMRALKEQGQREGWLP